MMTEMKKIFISVLGAVLISLCGCSLEETPYSITAGKLSETETGAEQLVTGVYGTFWDNWMMEQTYMAWVDQDHDHCMAPAWVMKSAATGDVTSHYSYNGYNDLWSVFYRLINRTNTAMETLSGTASFQDGNEVFRQYYGEMLFMRAFAYFHLVRMYGAVPLRLTSQSESECPRSPVKDIYDTIVNDLETSLEHLHYPSEGNVGAWGHADKTAAQILLARVYCTMGASALTHEGVKMICDIKGTDTTFDCDKVAGAEGIDAEACYTRAKELCDEVIKRKGTDFDMMPNYLSLWGGNNRKNKEFVWGANSNAMQEYCSAGLAYYCTPAPYGGAGAWLYLSPHLYDLYEEQDHRQVYGVWHYYRASYTGNWYGYPYNSEKYNEANMPTELSGFHSGFSNNKNAAPCCTKWYNGDIANPTLYSAKQAQYVDQDVVLIRFAEAYLLRAEAQVELGNVDAAMADVDVIRSRANAATLYSGVVTDKLEARSLVLKERGLELCQEFNRKFDLLRWGLYLDVMNTTQNITLNTNVRSLVRTEKNLLYAIPTNEIAENSLLGGNNYGY